MYLNYLFKKKFVKYKHKVKILNPKITSILSEVKDIVLSPLNPRINLKHHYIRIPNNIK